MQNNETFPRYISEEKFSLNHLDLSRQNKCWHVEKSESESEMGGKTLESFRHNSNKRQSRVANPRKHFIRETLTAG